MPNRFGLPDLGVGVGLRATHYPHILEREPDVAWFEIISENYMHTSGRPRLVLDRIAAKYPVAMHGVSMSIGSTDPLDMEYLRELRALRDAIGARWVTDHLCWTGVAGTNTHDLLPLPYTEEAVRHVARRVAVVQDVLGSAIGLENPSTYVEFSSGTMREWEFLAAVAGEADCAILLDVNNVYVNAYNHGFDPRAYLDAVPFDRVVQLHVAGHTRHATHIVDTHTGPVDKDVWDLLGEAWVRAGGASVLLEWDMDIPPFEEVHGEALRASEAIARARSALAFGTRRAAGQPGAAAQ
jgi:uncharacterized protein (UPF0276 family)